MYNSLQPASLVPYPRKKLRRPAVVIPINNVSPKSRFVTPQNEEDEVIPMEKWKMPDINHGQIKTRRFDFL